MTRIRSILAQKGNAHFSCQNKVGFKWRCGSKPSDLKKILLKLEFDSFQRTCRDDKQDGSLPVNIKRMIEWL